MNLVILERADGTAVVSWGERSALDASKAEELRQRVGEVQARCPRLIFDMSQVDFVDMVVKQRQKLKRTGTNEGELAAFIAYAQVRLPYVARSSRPLYSIAGVPGQLLGARGHLRRAGVGYLELHLCRSRPR